MVGTTVLRVAHPTRKEIQGDKWVAEDVKWEIKSLAVWKDRHFCLKSILTNKHMLIKVTSKEACEKIATLLRPSLRSVPVSINIFEDETFMNWKNKQVTCVKVSIIGINICAQSLEIVFMGAHGVPHGPVIIPIEYE